MEREKTNILDGLLFMGLTVLFTCLSVLGGRAKPSAHWWPPDLLRYWAY